jgi:hypothetical protein
VVVYETRRFDSRYRFFFDFPGPLILVVYVGRVYLFNSGDFILGRFDFQDQLDEYR